MKFIIILIQLNLIAFNYAHAKTKREILSRLYLPPNEFIQAPTLKENPTRSSSVSGALIRNPSQQHFTIVFENPWEQPIETYQATFGNDAGRKSSSFMPFKSHGRSFSGINPDYTARFIKPVGGYISPVSYTNFRYINYPIHTNLNVDSGLDTFSLGSSLSGGYFGSTAITTFDNHTPLIRCSTIHEITDSSDQQQNNFNKQNYDNAKTNQSPPPSYAVGHKGLRHYKSPSFLAREIGERHTSSRGLSKKVSINDEYRERTTTESSKITFKSSSRGIYNDDYSSSVQGKYEQNQFDFRSQLYLPPSTGSDSSSNPSQSAGSYLPPIEDSIPGSSYLPYTSTSLREPIYPELL